MCYQILQSATWARYAAEMPCAHANDADQSSDACAGGVLDPGRAVLALYPDDGFRHVRWGLSLANDFATGRLQTSVSAEMVMRAPAWRCLWRLGRVIVPVDGWFECRLTEHGQRRLGCVRAKDGRPVYLCALCSVPADPMQWSICHIGEQGLVLLHHTPEQATEARVLSLPAQYAREWLHGRPERAAQLIDHADAPSRFEWSAP